jgi:amidase
MPGHGDPTHRRPRVRCRCAIIGGHLAIVEAMDELIGRSATTLSTEVAARRLHPREVVVAHLRRIEEHDPVLHAFRTVRAAAALAEADSLAARTDLAELPLAGVPIAVKDNVPVAGETMTVGSRATPTSSQTTDSEVVRRLRAAGAVVVGITACPELCLWGTTDGPHALTRNPWDLSRTPGGSSGGSAAAVAAALVPLAHATDGLGSLRIPAAGCGLVGIKPGHGIVPAELGTSSWFGMAEHGPLATTVADAALFLAVLADRPDLGTVEAPERLRIGVSTRSPLRGLRSDGGWAAAARSTAQLLASAGHVVVDSDISYPPRAALGLIGRWLAAAAEDAEGLEPRALERRTRRHAAIGRRVRRAGLVRETDRRAWRAHAAEVFADVDVLLTPTLAQDPVPALRWSDRSWSANVRSNLRYAPLTSPWNLAGYPVMAVPVPHPDGLRPWSVQLVAPDGGEQRLLALAGQLEALRPWRRHAPMPPVVTASDAAADRRRAHPRTDDVA